MPVERNHPAEPRPFRLAGRLRSFRYAARGLWVLLRSQHNAWIHAAATGAVFAAGFFFGLSALEWCAVILSIAAVWTAEALNTALELLADAATREFHPLVERAKDVAAGAVLVAAIAALLVGALVFWPHVWEIAG